MAARRRPAVFLDRDGTLMEDVGYPSSPSSVKLVPGAVAALRKLGEAGLALVVVSNQSGVARGLISVEEARAVHGRLVDELRRAGVVLDGSYYCLHGPDDACECRKPAPGMIVAAASELDLDLTRSTLVGDKETDVEAGRAAGCRTVLLDRSGPGRGGGAADHTADSWREAVRVILERKEQDGSS